LGGENQAARESRLSIPTATGVWRSASSGAAVAGWLRWCLLGLTVSRHAVAIGVGLLRCKGLGWSQYGIALLLSLFRCVRAGKDRPGGLVGLDPATAGHVRQSFDVYRNAGRRLRRLLSDCPIESVRT